MDWIFSCNPNKYDLHRAIHDLETIDWTCKFNVEVGDRVYLYSSAPEKAIFYRCVVVKANKTVSTVDDSMYGGAGLASGTLFKGCELKLEQEYAKPGITYDELLKHGLKPGVLAKRKILEPKLKDFLDNYRIV